MIMRKLAAPLTGIFISLCLPINIENCGSQRAIAQSCAGECPAPQYDEIQQCKESCHRSYVFQQIFCGAIPDAAARAICWAHIANDLGNCINSCY